MKQCQFCHKPFKPQIGHANKFCSAKCFHDSRKGNWISWNKGKKVPYKARPSMMGRIPWNKGKKGVMPVPWNKGKKCNYLLGNTWGYKKSHIPWNKKLKGKYPIELRKKFSEAQNGKKILATRGKNHWNWKGGRTLLRKFIQQLNQYKEWRVTIFKRDGWKCVLCGKGRRIIADHYPVSFAEICDRWNIKSVDDARKCDLLWDISNGRTLCKDCHKKTDTYGFKGLYFKRTKTIG